MDWKKVSKYAKYGLYVIPFYGAIDQYKKPKEKRSKAGVIFSDAVIVSLIIKLGILYGGKVAATGNWNPFYFNSKDKKEQVEDIPNINNLERQSDLEKTVKYTELLK